MIILYLFALLSLPSDRLVCDIWTRALTQEAFLAACPNVPLTDLRLDVYSLDMQLVCSRPANLLIHIQRECTLAGSLDDYILRIVKPAQQDILCMVESASPSAPSAEEIAAQCPGIPTAYVIQPAGSREEMPITPACPIQTIEPGAGLYQQVSTPADLASDEDLPLLAGRLIWFGFADASQCLGFALDADLNPTPCGLAASRAAVLQWQNQFDESIYTAALTYHVPARLLKRIMLVESSMWAFYGAGKDGEIGIMQVTDNGLDTLLRFDPSLDPLYITKDADAQLWARAAARPLFHADSLPNIHAHMPYYARLLAAYHCRALTLNPALTGSDAWRIAVIHYNGAPEYLLKIER